MAESEPSKQAATAPVVWLLTDNKPGHRNQLKGLGNRLHILASARIYWVDASRVRVPLWRSLLALPPPLNAALPRPDLVIAAGSGTHRLLLALRKRRGIKTLVIMKPAFPLFMISGALIPAHDRATPDSRTLITEGVLNAVTPIARLTNKPKALVLIGGPSPHGAWNNDRVLVQIAHLIGRYTDWHWTISTSRRTPEPLKKRLNDMANLQITVVHPEQTHEDWLTHQLSDSRAVWVTPDSMSMVCEAATSGVPTGLLDLPKTSGSRVVSGIERLVRNGHVAQWTDHASVMAGKADPDHRLWEANRAARWLLDNGFLANGQNTNQRLHKGTQS